MRGVTGYHGWVKPMLEPAFLLRKAGWDPGAKNIGMANGLVATELHACLLGWGVCGVLGSALESTRGGGRRLTHEEGNEPELC